MEDFVSQFGGWLGLIAAVMFGVFAIYGLFNKNSKALKSEESSTAKDLIDLLGTKVTVLEGKVTDLEAKVEALTTENKTLRDVLQGRDSETKQFYSEVRDGLKSISTIAQRAEHNDKVSEDNSKALMKITTLLESGNKKSQ